MKNTFKLQAIQRIAAIRKIAGIIVFMAVIGFSMAACSDDPGTTLSLTSVTTGTMVTSPSFSFNIKTSFAINEKVAVRLSFANPDENLKKVSITVKNGDTVVWANDATFPNNPDTNGVYLELASFASAGNFKVEAYLTDLKDKKSNTLSASFTVN